MDDFVGRLIRYGMFIAAMFQLVCIAAAILLPEQTKSSRDDVHFDLSDGETDGMTQTSKKLYNHHRIRKQDKKKRR